MSTRQNGFRQGISAALSSAIFLGLTPVFGKQAITLGLHPVGVVAIRTVMAAALLFFVMVLFKREYLYIYPAGLLGCLLAGGINGLGSLFFYNALGRLDASVGQLLYSLYPLFLVLWLWFDHQPPNRLTLVRLILTIPALYLLTRTEYQEVSIVGMVMMLIAAALFALHLPINQRVLYEMPAPTVTLYTLFAMSAVVVPAFFITMGTPFRLIEFTGAVRLAWLPLFGLTLATFLSRLALFLGVKRLGGMQTAILGLFELLVTIIFSHWWLGERLSNYQWLGALLLAISLSLIVFERQVVKKQYGTGWLAWIRPPGFTQDLPWPHEEL